MKKELILSILLCLSLSASAQQVKNMRIYRQGGAVDTLRMQPGSTIEHSRIDQNGVSQPDYVTLQVTNDDGTRSYLLSDLDSLVLPTGRTVVFHGYTSNVNDNGNGTPQAEGDTSLFTPHYSFPKRTSFSGSFPGGDKVTYYWMENDHIRLDVGNESRAKHLSQSNTKAVFLFEDADFEAEGYTVYYPDREVTIQSHQTQTGANNTDHLGVSGDCGVADALRQDDGSYSFALNHKASYLCFLPHIAHLPSAKLTRIEVYCEKPIAGRYSLSQEGLYSASNTSYSIALDLVSRTESDFFIGHDIHTEQDSIAAFMVIAPQDAARSFTVTYYVTDTLSRISKVYRQNLSFQPLANTVHPITYNISDNDFHAIDLGLTCNWSNRNASADEPGQKGVQYATEEEANNALLTETVVTQWLMPDEDQKEELIERCTWTRGVYNGTTGYLVEGASVSKEYHERMRIFIPCDEGMTPAECLSENWRPVEALMIDLGLTSGTKWAARNIGANSVEDYGYYFAWGETETKPSYTSGNYKWGTRNLGDNFDISGTQVDAAVVNWGGLWRMPTYDQMNELKNSCNWQWSPVNGVNGYVVTGLNGNKIFLPAAGYMDGTSANYVSSGGVYLTSRQGGNSSSYAYTLGFSSSSRVIYHDAPWNNIFSYNNPFPERRIGHTIRPVTSPNGITEDGLAFDIHTDSTTWKLGDVEARLYATLSSDKPLTHAVTVGFVIGDSATVDTTTARFRIEKEVDALGSYTLSQAVFDNIGYWYRAYIKTTDTIFYGAARHYAYEMVDLGLSVKWANMNIGASVPSDHGDHYAWGETEFKDSYTVDNYEWYKNSHYYNLGDDLDIAGTEEDVAHVKMGNAWRLPTYKEMDELFKKCTWQWSTQDNVSGYKVTGPSGNSIFLPAAGYKDGTTHVYSDWGGIYLTSTQSDNRSGYAYTLGFKSDSRVIYHDAPWNNIFTYNNPFPERRIGHSVRAVAIPNGEGKDGIVLNARTDSATWRINNTVAVLHGTLSSTTPINEDVTVGFIIGTNDSIKQSTALAKYPQTVHQTGQFHQQVPVHDNIGYWYRTYVEHADTVYYGKALHYGLEMVDLGIGTLWANMNVDASSPEECGGYYAWGETSVKDNYVLAGYKGYNSTLNHYINMGDDFDISNTDLDVAHVRMGNAWRMPTNEELTKLKEQCTWTWSSLNNVSGYRVTGPNGNSIFLPAGGYKNGTAMSQLDDGCVYPSSKQGGIYYNGYAYTLAANSTQRVIYNDAPWTNIFSNNDPFPERRIGHTIRAVAIPNAVNLDSTIVMNILTDSASWKIRDTEATLYGTVSSTKPMEDGTKIGFVVGNSDDVSKSNGTVYTLATTGYGSFSQKITGFQYSLGYWYRAYVEMPNGETFYGAARHVGLEMVDLGLSVKWANMNLEASSPEDFGAFYTWGETSPKETYTVENNVNGTTTLGMNGDIQCSSNYDAAYVCKDMGNNWCLPTSAQMSELMSGCTWTWSSLNSVSGWRVTGSNEKSIFLPAAGYKSYTNYYFEDKCGSYMTATQGENSSYCYVLDFNSETKCMYYEYVWNHMFGSGDGNAMRYVGHSVRPIAIQ